MKRKNILYPGSFDPITVGHVNIIKKIIGLFNSDDFMFLLGVANNSAKNHMYDFNKRQYAAKTVLLNTVDEFQKEENGWGGLGIGCIAVENSLAETFKNHQIDIMVRGIRDEGDFRYERGMDQFARDCGVQTIFITPDPEFAYVSSSMIRNHMAGNNPNLKSAVEKYIPVCLQDEEILTFSK